MRKLLLLQALTHVNGNGILVNAQQPFGGDVSPFLPLRSSASLHLALHAGCIAAAVPLVCGTRSPRSKLALLRAANPAGNAGQSRRNTGDNYSKSAISRRTSRALCQDA